MTTTPTTTKIASICKGRRETTRETREDSRAQRRLLSLKEETLQVQNTMMISYMNMITGADTTE